MEYLTGSLITLVGIYFAMRFLKDDLPKKNKEIRYSQSHIHEVIKPLLPYIEFPNKKIVSQSSLHEEKVKVRVIIFDNQAYWIKNNLFYTAEVINNIIEKETAQIVDTMSMNKVQLDQMLFIMDQLREGKTDDSGNSGYK